MAVAKQIKYCGRKIKCEDSFSKATETRKQLTRKEPYRIFAKSVIDDIFTHDQLGLHLDVIGMTVKCRVRKAKFAKCGGNTSNFLVKSSH